MRWLDRTEEFLIAGLMAVMTLLTFMQVVARYVFNYSFVWTLELTGVLFAWLIFIGMSYGVRVGAHIGVDAVVRLLPRPAARAIAAVAAVLCIAYALIVAWGGWQYTHKMYDVGIIMQDMPVAQWIPRVVLPLGFLLLALRFGQALRHIVRGDRVHLIADETAQALELRQDAPPPEAAP